MRGVAHGDSIEVAVYASDGHGGSSARASNRARIINRVPSAGSVTISPSGNGERHFDRDPPAFADADSDPLTYHYQWLRDSLAVTGATGARLDLTKLAPAPGEIVGVRVTASNGHGGMTRPAQIALTLKPDPVIDTGAFAVTLRARGRQHSLATRMVTVRVSTSMPCTVTARGKVTVKRRDGTPSLRASLRTKQRTLAAGAATVIRLRLSHSTVYRVKRELAKGKRIARVRIAISAVSAAGRHEARATTVTIVR